LFLLLVILFGSAVADWYVVPTASMKPNILEGDRVLVNKLHYDLRLPFTHLSLLHRADPRRGDIVVLDSPVASTRLIKRVIGVPGDVVAMRDNHLFINGRVASYRASPNQPDPAIWDHESPKHVFTEQTPRKSYPIAVASASTRGGHYGPVLVPDGHYFVMGDNRDNSGDSRYFGFVPRDHVLGRARLIVMSLNYDNYYLPRSGRYLQSLP
jgi:signal peptidase I